MKKVYYHLPGLFEFHTLYKKFLPLFYTHRDYFYDWCEIGSIYGAPSGCIWSGGRIGYSDVSVYEVLRLSQQYGISSRLTFSNSLLEETHLSDVRCNELCRIFEQGSVSNGIIVHSECLLSYLKKRYPNLYFVSSTTKVITDFQDLVKELSRTDFTYVVPDFRLNKQFNQLMRIREKDKVEFLVNECCFFGCTKRKTCYEAVSRVALKENVSEFICDAPGHEQGYQFSKVMKNPGFISVSDILERYVPMGYANFKIEGRGLGNALILEILIYYMVKPEYQIHVREALYLDNMLDLF